MSTDSIDSFIEHFENQLRDVRQTTIVLHRKILYAAMLDPFSRACFGRTGTHRDRVTRLIEQLSGWRTHSGVSLPQLKLNLEVHNEESNGSLYEAVCRALSKWPEGQIVRLDRSLDKSALEALAVNKEQGELLESSRYVALFYTYRNVLVHEFREPGYGIEFSNDGSEPYYHGMIDNPWQLVYPVEFFDSLISSILDNLRTYFTSNCVTPHDQFEFGSLWRSR